MVKDWEAHYVYLFQGVQNGKSSLSLRLSLPLPASIVVLEPLWIHFIVGTPVKPTPPPPQLTLDLTS